MIYDGGGGNTATPPAKIVSNWSRKPLGGVQKLSLKTQDTFFFLLASLPLLRSSLVPLHFNAVFLALFEHALAYMPAATMIRIKTI